MAKYISIDKLEVMAEYSKLAEKGMCEELQEIIANAKKCAEDVVGRSKVDKAIEKMGKEVYEVEDFLGIRKDVIAFDDVLEILKRNIGD